MLHVCMCVQLQVGAHAHRVLINSSFHSKHFLYQS